MNLVKIIMPFILTITFVCKAEQTETERLLSQELTKAVMQINAKGPQLLDEETRLDSATTVKNFLVYNHTMVNYTAEQLDVKIFESNMEKIVIGTLCDNKGLEVFTRLGVIMVYRYRGKNGQFISELSKDMAKC